MNLAGIHAHGPNAAVRRRNIKTTNEVSAFDMFSYFVAFHHSPLCIEMLELRGFQYKFLPPYTPYFMAIECMFSEWKHYVKVGLAGNRARDRVELNARINQFVLVPEHAARYAQHIANNCLAYTRGVRVFDN